MWMPTILPRHTLRALRGADRERWPQTHSNRFLRLSPACLVRMRSCSVGKRGPKPTPTNLKRLQDVNPQSGQRRPTLRVAKEATTREATWFA